MTAKQVFEYALIELNKVKAPSLLLEDYNYFINKAINQYVNKVYNMYDVNQQKSDDVRVLKSTASLDPDIQNDLLNTSPKKGLFDSTYEVNLPDDYLHILNCVVEYRAAKNYKCYDEGDKIYFGATRLTSDMFAQIINNYYMRPSYKQPYYYINNITTENDYPERVDIGPPLEIEKTRGTKDTQEDVIYKWVKKVPNPKYPLTSQEEFVYLPQDDNRERVSPNRFGNKSKVRMEIRYGRDNTLFILQKVYIDYLKAPQFIRLTQDQVDMVQDGSQILEFQDYVCQEIVNELVTLLLENSSDPRLQSQIPVNQSIATPQQEGQQQRRR